jgi:ABC-type amino acid transport substrate-binding protein
MKDSHGMGEAGAGRRNNALGSSSRHAQVLLALTVILATFSGAVGQGGGTRVSIDLTPEEEAWLKDHPVIRNATDPDYAPIEFRDAEDKVRGMAQDYLVLVGERLGIRFETVKSFSWAASLYMVRSREADVVGAATETAERSQYMLFTRSYIDLPDVILVREGDNTISTMADLRGKTVTIIKGWGANDWIRENYPHITLELVPDIKTALQSVSFGWADATILGLAQASYTIELNHITNLRAAGETGYVYHLALGSRKDWPILNSVLDKALASITEEERSAIAQKWIFLRAVSWRPDVRFWGGFIAIMGLVLVVILLSWNRSLKRLVHERTLDLQRELTERKRLELEREKVIGELQATLEDVKTLRGILPMCANCKKIRDDKGYWQLVEVYIHEHTDAEFTHGLCLDCIHNLYPELGDSMDDGGEAAVKKEAEDESSS